MILQGVSIVETHVRCARSRFDPWVAGKIFPEGDVKYLMQACHKLLNHPTYFVTILVVVTKELYSNSQPSRERTCPCIKLCWSVRGCKNRLI